MIYHKRNGGSVMERSMNRIKWKRGLKRTVAGFCAALMVFDLMPAGLQIKASEVTVGDGTLVYDNDYDKSAEDLVQATLSGELTATDCTKQGTVYTFKNGTADVGIDHGIILDTSGEGGQVEEDPDLANLVEAQGQAYGWGTGGDTETSVLEFSMTATGTLLNFNYAFSSNEFVEPEEYNDIFGLFVSVNGGTYENIALIKRSDETTVPVTITNLRAGLDGTEMDHGTGRNPQVGTHSLFQYKTFVLNNTEMNGVSNVFNAKKAVSVGDEVKIKFAVCNVGDSYRPSFVYIQGESLGFEEKEPGDHTHDWSFASDGATITATCADTDGQHGTPKTTSLTLTKPALTIYGGTGSGDVIPDGLASFKTETGLKDDAIVKKYYKATKGTDDTYTKASETALEGVPADAGDYIAEVTINGVKTAASTSGTVTASIGYTIAKAKAPELTNEQKPTAKIGLKYDETYGESGQPLVNPPTSAIPSGYTIKYSLDGTNWSEDIPKGTDAGDYTVKVKYEGDQNHEDKNGDDMKVTIGRADQAAPAKPTATEENIGSVSITLTAVEGCEYGRKKGESNEIEWQESPAFTGLTKSTEYTFYQRRTEDANHNASPISEAAVIKTGDHSHNWSFAADGATITATCADTDGQHGTPKTTALTLTKPALTTYGGTGSGDVILDGLASFKTETGLKDDAIVKKYYKATKGTDGTYTKASETALEGVPADAGDYIVEVTINGVKTAASASGTVTVSIGYTIRPKQIKLKAADASKFYEGQDPQLTAYTILDAANGEELSGVTLTGISLTRVQGEEKGTYDITFDKTKEQINAIAQNHNYQVTELIKGTFTIDYNEELIAEKRTKAKQAVEQKASKTKENIDKLELSEEEKEAYKEEIDNQKKAAQEEIDKKVKLQDIETEKKKAEDALDALELDADKQEAKDTVDKKAEDAKKEIDKKNISDARKETIKKEVDKISEEAKKAIGEAKDPTGVTNEEEKASDDLADKVLDANKQEIKDALDKKAEEIKDAMNSMNLPEREKEALKEEVDSALEEAKKAIDDAKDQSAVTSQKEEADKKINDKLTEAKKEAEAAKKAEEAKKASPQPTPSVASVDPAKENELALNAGFKVSQKGKKITVKWGEVKDADGYQVYASYCGKTKPKRNKTVKGRKKTSTTIKQINGKDLVLTRNYKIVVQAYKIVKGKKVVIAKSVTAHIVGARNKQYTNVKGIVLSQDRYTLKPGQSATVSAKTVKVYKNREELGGMHAKQFRYASSDKKIAVVSEDGVIAARAKGSCYVYVYARNGYAKKILVTVN